MTETVRVRILIHGAVQGVGFRPFVYRLASEMKLCGWVSNSSQGVQIEAEGRKDQLDGFVLRIDRERPRHASIQSMEISFLDYIGFANFEIHQSNSAGAKSAVVLPDIATCPDCLSDIFDRSNRRFLYPFTN